MSVRTAITRIGQTLRNADGSLIFVGGIIAVALRSVVIMFTGAALGR